MNKPGKPTRVTTVAQLRHDGASHRITVRTSQPTQVILVRPRVQILQLEDICFGTDHSVLLPAVVDDDAAPVDPTGMGRRDGLAVVVAALAFAHLHPARKLLVVGHTDSVGDAAYNVELSRRRAHNVLLYLTGDRQAWAQDSAAYDEISDFKRVHRWAAQRLGWNTDPGTLDDEWNATAKAARDEFRRQCEALLDVSLPAGAKQSADDWAAIFDLYEQEVARSLQIKVEELATLRKALSSTEPAVLGCGEQWPVASIGVDDLASAENRRVDLLFFDPEEIPQNLAEEPAGAAIYGAKRYKAEYIPAASTGGEVGLTEFEVNVQLRDHWLANPVPSTPYRLRGPVPEHSTERTGVTDANGCLRERELLAGDFVVECGQYFTVVNARMTKVLDPEPIPDVHRLAGLNGDAPAGERPVYQDGWVVFNAGAGDFVDHDLDDDFDDESEQGQGDRG